VAIVKKKTVKKVVAKKAPAKKTAAKKAQPAAKKTVTKKSVAKKVAVKAKPAQKAVKAPAARPSRPKGLPEQLRDAALKILDERKAEDIVTFDLGGRSSVADYLIVASGRASRQLAAIAHYLDDAFVTLGAGHPRIEGLPEANWVLIDSGDVIIHLFLPEVRGYYNLEGIWSKRGA